MDFSGKMGNLFFSEHLLKVINKPKSRDVNVVVIRVKWKDKSSAVFSSKKVWGESRNIVDSGWIALVQLVKDHLVAKNRNPDQLS